MATPTSGRKTRRRDGQASSLASSSGGGSGGADNNDDSLPSAYDLYNVMGDSKTACDIFIKSDKDGNNAASQTIAKKYNCMLLSSLSTAEGGSESTSDRNSSSLLEQIDKLESEFRHRDEKTLSARKRKRDELIRAHNRALVLMTETGDYSESAKICLSKLHGYITNKSKPHEELAIVTSRMALILLECVLALSVGRTRASTSDIDIDTDHNVPSPTDILDWLDVFDSEKDPQLKFLLNLYRSRFDLSDLDELGKHNDNRIRSARKELKQAMDVLQHKLRPSFGAETSGSVVSATNSEENMSLVSSQTAMTNAPHNEQLQPGSVVLQKHNRSALILKANSEQLKGNTKKSLILCSEAMASVSTDNGADPSYETIHDNNLAVVYETIGKRHLALHALAKGLRRSNDNGSDGSSSTTSRASGFYSDGTARPDKTLLVLHNAAICALQARNYLSAYECMATCVARSNIFQNRPRCWIRMAEACVGLFSELKSQNSNGNKFAAVEIDGEPRGIVVDNKMFTDQPEVTYEDLVPSLATPEDLEQVKRSPLLRARACLEHALKFGEELGNEALMSSRLTLSFIHLAFRRYDDALEIAKLVLDAPDLPETADEISNLAHWRRIATARMYAAEASCAMGETMDAMKFLVGDGQDDAFDRLASDLSGVTIETAAANGKGKRRLARAQTVVRTNAAGVTAAMGNLTAAKQLAMSAQAMEDAYASNRERSSARRALIYTLLRGGHHGPALSLLRSLR